MTATVAGVSWGVATDRGTRRQVNEDSFLARFPVFVVADGMGGHESGEVASAYTIEALRGEAARLDRRLRLMTGVAMTGVALGLGGLVIAINLLVR